MAFEDKVCEQLAKPLPHDVVKTRQQAGQKLSYIEGWYAIEVANEVFGFGGWSYEVVATTVLHSEPYKRNDKSGYSHVVRSHVRVRVGDVVRDDIGIGVGELPSPALAIELAEKAAATDGLKRALKSFGNRFGLALYDKEQSGVGATREAQRMIDELGACSDVDAWVRANKDAVAKLGAADQADVKAAAGRRREAIKRKAEAPAAPKGQAPAEQNTGNATADNLLKRIADAKGPKPLAEVAAKILSAALTVHAAVVHAAYAARWVKCFESRTDHASLTAAVQAFELVDEVYRREHLSAVEAAIAAAEKTIVSERSEDEAA